jgi:hypothetical protein
MPSSVAAAIAAIDEDVILYFVEKLQSVLCQRLILALPISLNLPQPVSAFACLSSARGEWQSPQPTEKYVVPVLLLFKVIVPFLPFSVTRGGTAIFSFLKPSDEVPAFWSFADPDRHFLSGFVFRLDEVTDHISHILVEQRPMREVVFEIARGGEISVLFLFWREGWVAALKFDVLHVLVQKGKRLWSVSFIVLSIRQPCEKPPHLCLIFDGLLPELIC